MAALGGVMQQLAACCVPTHSMAMKLCAKQLSDHHHKPSIVCTVSLHIPIAGHTLPPSPYGGSAVSPQHQGASGSLPAGCNAA